MSESKSIPDSSGWWLVYESGDIEGDAERVLVNCDYGTATIAYDEEWTKETGIDISDGDIMCLNYWEGSDCATDFQAGAVWVKDPDQKRKVYGMIS